MAAKSLIRVVVVVAVFGGVLFLGAGRSDWPEAWWLTGLYASFLFGFMVWGLRHAPGLMRERARVAGNVKRWDKIINLIFTLAFIGTLALAGLDARFGWSEAPLLIKIAGGTGVFFAGGVILWTLTANSFLSRWARIQEERGHRVISHGPYRFVRHPMYAAIILFILCTPLELGSWAALAPAGLAATIYVLRTKKEDAMLHEELEGYRDYAAKVGYRLMPGVW